MAEMASMKQSEQQPATHPLIPADTGRFGRRAVLSVAGILTLALGLSAGYSFFTLQDLRATYLESRAQDVAALVGRGIRGPGRFNNSELWKSVFQSAIDNEPQSIQFLALADGAGRLSQQSGLDTLKAITTFEDLHADGTYFSIHNIAGRRGGPPWAGAENPPQTLRLGVGVSTESTAFIQRQAYADFAISAAAILAIWLLSYYLLRTSRRLVELRVQEEADRHLANLGRMSATLAHEIRNPLGAMKGLTQVIQEELPKDHTAQAMIATVIGEAERLEHLVSDLLTFARPSSGNLASCDYRQLVSEMLTFLGPEAEQTQVKFQAVLPSEPVSAQTDIDGLKQVLLNTLKNAIEASPGGGTVLVQLSSDSHRQWVRILIADEGAGLGSLDSESVFEPFRTTKMRGSGLGLPISRRIVSRLGGTIRLDNRPEGGAICSIELPFQPASARKPTVAGRGVATMESQS